MFGCRRNLASLVRCLLVLLVVIPRFAWSQSDSPSQINHNPTVDISATQNDAVQIASPKLDKGVASYRIDVDLVLVPVLVTDGLNRPVLGLEKQDFAIYEDDAAQTIRFFASEAGPLSIALVLDFSKSMTNKMEAERAAIEQFFANANPEDEYFVVTVSSRPNLIASSAKSIEAIEVAIAPIVPDGNTALLDAIYLAANQLEHAHHKRRAMLIISDGGDNNSRYGMKQVRKMLEEADIEAYAIGIFDTIVFKTYEEFWGKRWLASITDSTGGHTISVDNVARLPKAAAEISWELRNQYVIGYKPMKVSRHGGRRKIKVKVARKGNMQPLQVYYKREYSAPRQ
jgi:Ca-activated chloride channel family protein